MTKYQLYRLIEKTEEFKDKRHPMFERNKFMKFLGWFMIAYYAALMLIMGVSMGFALKGDNKQPIEATIQAMIGC